MDSEKYYSYLVLNQVMRPDYRRNVITCALDFRKQASKQTRSNFNAIAKKKIKNVKGHSKDCSGAPTSFLIEPTIKGFAGSSDVVWAILGLWLESQSELSGEVEKFIIHQNICTEKRYLSQSGFVGYWSTDKMKAFTDKFLKDNPNENYDDVALMLCCLTGQAPIPGVSEQEIEGEPTTEQQVDVEEVEAEDNEIESISADDPIDEQPVEVDGEIEVSDPVIAGEHINGQGETSEITNVESEKVGEQLENPGSATVVPNIEGQNDPQNQNEGGNKVEEISPIELEQIYSTLLGSLDAARELLVAGKLDQFESWAIDYHEQVKKVVPSFDNLAGKLKDEYQNLESLVDSGHFGTDSEPLLAEIRTLGIANALTLSEQIGVFKSIQSIKIKVESCRVRRESIRTRSSAALANFARITERARQWKIGEVKLTSPSQPAVETASSQELESATEQIEKICSGLEQEIIQLRSSLIAELLEKCKKISSEASTKDKSHIGEAFTKELTQIQESLTDEISDQDLLLLLDRIDSLNKRMNKTGISLEVVEAADAYLKDPHQLCLDFVLYVLWNNGYFIEAFILLTSGLRGMRWQSGKSLPENGLSNYVRGLVAITHPDELIAAAVDMLADGLLSSVILFEKPEDIMSMVMLYTSLMLSQPGALPKEALWSFKNDTIDYMAPSWQRVAEGLMVDNCPLIVEKSKLDFRELKELEKNIVEVFRRDGGKYLHLIGAGSKTLLNKEQQVLLPYLEGLWRNIQENHPSQVAWNNLKQKIESIAVEDYFAHYCHEHGLVADINPHFRKVYEDRITEILNFLVQYMKLKEDAFNLTSKKPITWEDLQNELKASRNIIGDSIAQITERALQEAIRLDQPVPGSLSALDGINRRICRAVYTAEDLFYTLPFVLDWIGKQSLNTEKGWSDFFDTIISSLAKPISQEKLVEFYLTSHLPHIAEAIAGVNDNGEGLREAKSLDERIQLDIEDKKAALTALGGQLSEEETIWLAEKRYSLILSSLGERIDSLQQQLRKREKEQQAALKNLFIAVSELEPQLVERTELPAVTRDEIFEAFTAIRQVYVKSEIFRLDSAEAVLDEIRHLLEYPGASADGLYRAVDVLKAQNEPTKSRRDEKFQVIKDNSLAVIAEHFLNGDWKQLHLTKDSLSDKQREDRAELIGLWEKISGLPGEPSELKQANFNDLKRFSTLFAAMTNMYFGDIARVVNITHNWYSKPIPHFETKFVRPGTAALRNNIVLIFLTQSEFNRREFRELERIVRDEEWITGGYFLVFVAPIAYESVSDWMIRNYREKPCIVLDKEMLLEIVLSTDNPTATGRFRRILGRVAGPEKFDVFKYENLVDPDKEIFVGRADQIRALVNSDQSHAIYGGRRIGKSSLLNALNRELKSGGMKTAYISLEGPDVRDYSGVAIGSEILQKLGIGRACSSLSDFKSQMTSFFIQQPDASIVILLDEVDRYIVARQHDKQPHDLIHVFRSLYQEHHGHCRFILAGFIEMWRHLTGKGGISGQEDPWFNFLKHTAPLEGLPSDDAQKIVRQGFQEILGISFSNEAIPRKIVEATTGHPAFVQKFCERLHRHIFSQRSEEIRDEDIQSVFEDRKSENYLGFVNYTLKQNLNPLPRLIVYLLAIEKKENFSVDDVRVIASSYDTKLGELEETTWGDSMDELQVTSVIKKTQTPHVYQFTVPSYRKILKTFELGNQEIVYRLINKIINGASDE